MSTKTDRYQPGSLTEQMKKLEKEFEELEELLLSRLGIALHKTQNPQGKLLYFPDLAVTQKTRKKRG